mmetsp:Transcript_20525/g.50372  ORF Transcript_20525/g.50372 Transcript_20525/m.50372 type:complete len:315 (-) Transcript_20525:961-1905(-)
MWPSEEDIKVNGVFFEYGSSKEDRTVKKMQKRVDSTEGVWKIEDTKSITSKVCVSKVWMAHVQLGPLIVRIKENKSDNPPPALDYPLVYTDKLLYLEHNSQNKSCPVVIQFVKLGKRLHFPKSSDSFCFVYVEFSEAERRSNRMRNFHVTISNNKRESSHPKYSTCAAGNLASETGHLLIKMSPLPQILSTSDFASVQLLVLYAADCDGKTPLFLWKNVYRKILSEAGKEQLEPRCMEFKNVDDIKNSFPPTGIKRKNGIYSIRDSSRILKMKIWNVSGPAGQKRPKQSNNYEFEINYEAIKVEAKNIGCNNTV